MNRTDSSLKLRGLGLYYELEEALFDRVINVADCENCGAATSANSAARTEASANSAARARVVRGE
jgi:hypothetical protein